MTRVSGKIIALIILTGVIASLHLIIPTDKHTLHILHIALRKLYFLPPVIAAAWYGLRGMAYVTLSITILFSLHATLDWPENYMEQANQGGELISFWVVGLVAAWLFERERLLLRELVQAHEETLFGLVSALDMKERNTRLHSQRVRQNTTLLASRLRIVKVRRESIALGALLHDVGKISVPDAILQKPGPLTTGEVEIMRQHPKTGYNIVNRIEFLREAAEIVYSHHEHFDGSGYPRGLSGNEIPLGARLFAVVDVYDALTSKRPYHAPMTHEEALAEIKKGGGHHFDPRVVTAFLLLTRTELDAA